MKKIQIIKEGDKEKFAVIEWDLFLKIKNTLESINKWQDIYEINECGKINLDLKTNPVRLLRKKAGVSQKKLADLLSVSQPYIAKLEKASKVSEKTLLQIEKALKKESKSINSILKIFK